MNTLGGAAQAYLHTGERHFLDTILHAHDELLAHQCFPTGGFGPDEQLLPRAAWRKKTDYSHNSFETQCGCFAVFKLCKYLMTITGDARYGDWVERLAYNGIAATIPMSSDGLVFYYSDYNALGGLKRNHSVGWSCCTGTRPMALADLHDLVYFHGADDLYVNLFVPSTVVWERAGGAVVVRQLTRFPESDLTHLVVALPSQQPSIFGLKVRVPGWLAGPLVVAINGKPVDAAADAHGWATVRREWRDGDRAEVRLPLKFAVRPLDDSALWPAMIVRGPLAMAVRSNGANASDLIREPDLEQSLVPSDGEPLTYRPRSGADLLVRPFYALKPGERYAIYLDPNRHSHRGRGSRAMAGASRKPSDTTTGPEPRCRLISRARAFDGSASDSTTPVLRRWGSMIGSSPRSINTVRAATSRSSGAGTASAWRPPPHDHNHGDPASGFEGAVHQHCRIRGESLNARCPRPGSAFGDVVVTRSPGPTPWVRLTAATLGVPGNPRRTVVSRRDDHRGRLTFPFR